MDFSRIALLGVLGILSISNAVAHAGCKNLVINLTDSGGATLPGDDAEFAEGETPRNVTMVIHCHKGSHHVPEGSTLYWLEFKDGKMCHSFRTCGNIKSWTGDFKIEGRWVPGSLSEVGDVVGDRTGARIDFKLDFKQISRTCSDLSDEVCQ